MHARSPRPSAFASGNDVAYAALLPRERASSPSPSELPLMESDIGSNATVSPRDGTFSPRELSRGGARREVVQMTSPLFFVTEGSAKAVVDVMRIGDALVPCAVEIHTEDGSARSPHKYGPRNDVIHFDPGEVLKSFEIVIVKDDAFDTTLEFSVYLNNPRNCVLGPYLHRTRVLIVDDDLFPSNEFQAVIEKGDDALETVSFQLLLAYMVFTFRRVPTIWWKSLLTAMLDQLHNVYYYFTLEIQVYLVDTVLNVEDPTSESRLLVAHSRYLSAVALALLWFLPNFALLGVERLKVGPLEMSRTIRGHLQVNLFRKYLNYTEESKSEVPVQDLASAMDSDLPLLVDGGYICIFKLLRNIGQIMVVGYFMLLKDRSSIIPLLLFPAALLLFVYNRNEQQVKLENEVMRAEEESNGMLVRGVEGFKLIRDYSMRSVLTNWYQAQLAENFKAQLAFKKFLFWSEELVPWLALASTGLYIAVGAQQVLFGFTSLGSFLTMIGVYQELGQRFQGLYLQMQNSVKALSPLVQITQMMNLSTDIVDRMSRNRMRINFMKQRMKAAKMDDPKVVLANAEKGVYEGTNFFDTIPLTLEKVTVHYIPALKNLSVEMHPDILVYITGQHGSGKATLVRLVSDIIMPESGHVLYSSHLRCLHCSQEAEVLPYLNLYENLVFGSKRPDPDRVRRIFKRVGLHHRSWLADDLEKDITDAIKVGDHSPDHKKRRHNHTNVAVEAVASDEDAFNMTSTPSMPSTRSANLPWHKRLSHMERRLVHIGRALIFNPEIMVMHHPVEEADSGMLEIILSILRETVDQRGFEMEGTLPDQVAVRRPHAGIFSGGEKENSAYASSMADEVWYLNEDHGFQVLRGGGGSESFCAAPSLSPLARPGPGPVPSLRGSGPFERRPSFPRADDSDCIADPRQLPLGAFELKASYDEEPSFDADDSTPRLPPIEPKSRDPPERGGCFTRTCG